MSKIDKDTITAYKNTLGKKGYGEQVVQDLITRFYILDTTAVKGDPQESDRREGMRIVVLHVLGILNGDIAQQARKATEKVNSNV